MAGRVLACQVSGSRLPYLKDRGCGGTREGGVETMYGKSVRPLRR